MCPRRTNVSAGSAPIAASTSVVPSVDASPAVPRSQFRAVAYKLCPVDHGFLTRGVDIEARDLVDQP